MAELLLGCGGKRAKEIAWQGRAEWSALTTLDINPAHRPDVVHDLEDLPLPFPDESFDEIHAYEVLEHVGRQGDWRFFFRQFSDFYRLLKPDGLLIGTSPAPKSDWAWGDPGHTRIVSLENFVFLHQPSYAQVGKTAMTDYRFVFRGDFQPDHLKINGPSFEYVLRAVKPSRIADEAARLDRSPDIHGNGARQHVPIGA